MTDHESNENNESTSPFERALARARDWMRSIALPPIMPTAMSLQHSTSPSLDALRTTGAAFAYELAVEILAVMPDVVDDDAERVQRSELRRAGYALLQEACILNTQSQHIVDVGVARLLQRTRGTAIITEDDIESMTSAMASMLNALYPEGVPARNYQQGRIVTLIAADTSQAGRVLVARTYTLTGFVCPRCELSPTGIEQKPGQQQDAQQTSQNTAQCIDQNCGEITTYKNTTTL